MKLQFKQQQFQIDAADAVCGVFEGQPKEETTYLVDTGVSNEEPKLWKEESEGRVGYRNTPIRISDKQILKNLQALQEKNGIVPSSELDRDSEEGSSPYNLTVEMETGVGKTYTYIKTMYELNKRYGWRKFIVVVPGIAIREGVYKSFAITEEHFRSEYGGSVRFFIYNSKKLKELDDFARDPGINVMIVNTQAFNATGVDARRIRMPLDEFQSRRPIDVIAATNPILIIDEPQAVEGVNKGKGKKKSNKTVEGLREFKALMTLRYSATPPKEYNLVYRLDAKDAYDQKLVKKIAVKGFSTLGTEASEGYLYLEGIKLSPNAPPKAKLHFMRNTGKALREVCMLVDEGFDVYAHSSGKENIEGVEAYRSSPYIVKPIVGEMVEFDNGLKLHPGDVVGKVGEEPFRRIQIRETILSHLEKERKLFKEGIKVLSLFFIDKVERYRLYEGSEKRNGRYAEIFEEEYRAAVETFQPEFDEEEYVRYLRAIEPSRTHEGYFSVDKKTGRMIDGEISKGVSQDVDAYDLIMKNKELLLDPDPERSPVRFIFSHSALKEGWDNPNVFQICTLKNSDSSVRKRQEIGRGLRLCVNSQGERMDEEALREKNADVHSVNVLTVIASESYESFAGALQGEIAEATKRPLKVDSDLFTGKTLTLEGQKPLKIDRSLAEDIVDALKQSGYIDPKTRFLTDEFQRAKKANEFVCDAIAKEYSGEIIKILDRVHHYRIDDGRRPRDRARLNEDRLASKEFQELWRRINAKSYYLIEDKPRSDEKGKLIDRIITNAIQKLNDRLIISKTTYAMKEGELASGSSLEEYKNGDAFKVTRIKTIDGSSVKARNVERGDAEVGVRYDLVGRLAETTCLTRRDIVQILTGIAPSTFEFFRWNPEEFIAKASVLINEAKSTSLVEHVAYHPLKETYSTDVFTREMIRESETSKVCETPQRNLYDRLFYDSDNENRFANAIDAAEEVAVYTKLPKGFYISTPVGNYNPDWAIAFKERDVKHIFFVAETKGSDSEPNLRGVERVKTECAKKHFAALCERLGFSDLKYEVVDSFKGLLEILTSATS